MFLIASCTLNISEIYETSAFVLQSYTSRKPPRDRSLSKQNLEDDSIAEESIVSEGSIVPESSIVSEGSTALESSIVPEGSTAPQTGTVPQMGTVPQTGIVSEASTFPDTPVKLVQECPFLDEAFKYIFALKNPANVPMHTTQRKTGFVGFLLAIKSIKGIFSQTVEQPVAPLKYLLTYKFSQDHLELFFGAIRASGGFNNNPTTLQFKAAYKRLLMRSSIQGGKGNCQKRDPTEILTVVTDTCKVNEEIVTLNDAALMRKYDLVHQPVPVQNDHNYCDYPNMVNLSEFKKEAVSYIAGYVAKMAEKKTHCGVCTKSLGSKDAASSGLINLKGRGGLFKPSDSVVVVCQEAEKCFMRMLKASGGNLPHSKGVPDAIATSVLEAVNLRKVFIDLHEHMYDTTVEENHVFLLIKVITKCYCTVRLSHLAKEATVDNCGDKIRKKFNKLVLFNHQ